MFFEVIKKITVLEIVEFSFRLPFCGHGKVFVLGGTWDMAIGIVDGMLV